MQTHRNPLTGNTAPSPAQRSEPADRTVRQRTDRKWRRVLARRLPCKRAALAMVAAIAVPALAAPEEWRTFDAATLVFAEEDSEFGDPMPFEMAGTNFPGSAYYFLEDPPELSYDLDFASASMAELAPGVAADLPINELPEAALAAPAAIGPAARRFTGGGTGVDKARAQQCLAMAVYYEAASEALDGQRAVAQVVLNRVAHPSYPNSVCGVVFQGSERRTGCQFSFTCDGSLARKPGRNAWARAQSVAAGALSGSVFAGVGYATHYHTTWVNPYWASSLAHIGTIGAHRFYRWHGAAGRPNAFSARYRGSEPLAAPKPRSASTEIPNSDPADPIALARAFEEARSEAEATHKPRSGAARSAPPPAYTAEIQASGGDAQFTANAMPDSGGVKEEYANSGRWLQSPDGTP